MTREDIENLVIDATGRDDKLDLIRRAINLGLEEISAERQWNDLLVEDDVTLNINDPSIELATDSSRIAEVRLIDGTSSYPIVIKPKTWLVKRYPNQEATSTGRPLYGYLARRILVVFPFPDVAYTIRYSYYRLHPAMTLPTSELLIRKGGTAIVAYVISWIWASLEKWDASNQWYARYTAALETAKKVDKDDSVVDNRATPRIFGEDDALVLNTAWWADPFVERMP